MAVLEDATKVVLVIVVILVALDAMIDVYLLVAQTAMEHALLIQVQVQHVRVVVKNVPLDVKVNVVVVTLHVTMNVYLVAREDVAAAKEIAYHPVRDIV